MSNIEQALADFSQEVGLPWEGTPSSGEIQFRLEDGSLLGLAKFESEVIVHWSRPLRYDVAGAMLQVMKHAAELRDAQQSVQVGLRKTPGGDWLVVGTRFPEDEVNVRRIREALDFLKGWSRTLDLVN